MSTKNSEGARTGIQRIRDAAITTAALGATVTVVGGVLVINGQPVVADGVGADIVVTALTDAVANDGETTLREALITANEDSLVDTITFDAALFANGPAEIMLDSPLGINTNVVIDGPGSESLTVSSSDSRAGIYVYGLYGAATLSVSGVTIESDASALVVGGGRRGAAADDQQAIIVPQAGSGGVVLDDVVLLSSSSRALQASRVSGAITITDSRLESGPYSSSGAADLQYVSGPIDISDTEITGAAPYNSILSVRYAESLTLTNVSVAQDSRGYSSYGGAVGVGVRAAGDVEISGSTVTGVAGTGISVSRVASLSIDESTVSGNSVAAISSSTSYGTLISNSTIANNGGEYASRDGIVSAEISDGFSPQRRAADDALAIGAQNGAALLVSNSTITGNEANDNSSVVSASAGSGYFYYYDGAAAASKELTGYETLAVLNSTISGNSAYDDGAYVLRSDGPVTVDHSIVTNNGGLYFLDFDLRYGPELAISADDASQAPVPFSPVSITRSVLPAEFEAGAPEGDGNVFADDADLGPLADNGGTTQTMLPGPTSVAINAGSVDDAIDVPEFDQRGASRVSGANLDIGAVETKTDSVDVSVATSSIVESAGSVEVTVTRTGAGEGEASVRVATVDGTATPGSDFTAIDEVVTFADGETGAKTVALTIAIDDVTEVDETVTVAISEATNLELANASVDITIVDDSVTPTTTTVAPTTTAPTTTAPTTTTPATTPATTMPATTPATTINMAPSVSPAANSGVQAGQKTVLVVFVDDADNEDVEVTATSSNPSLLKVVDVGPTPESNGGALVRASYSITVEAAPGASGTATITVSASDGTNTVTQTVDVEVSNAVLPATGSDSTTSTVMFAGLLVAAGAGATAFSRRRKLV